MSQTNKKREVEALILNRMKNESAIKELQDELKATEITKIQQDEEERQLKERASRKELKEKNDKMVKIVMTDTGVDKFHMKRNTDKITAKISDFKEE